MKQTLMSSIYLSLMFQLACNGMAPSPTPSLKRPLPSTTVSQGSYKKPTLNPYINLYRNLHKEKKQINYQDEKKQASYQANVMPYFLPSSEATESFLPVLMKELTRAKKNIQIAMYWFSFEPIADKLIELKKNKNLDIQVILDQSSFQEPADNGFRQSGVNVFDKLREADIDVFVHLSNFFEGIMHNKFIIIDEAKVITGSVNFTKQALAPSEQFNDENILVINSSLLVTHYRKVFENIKKNIINGEYINFILDSQKNPKEGDAITLEWLPESIILISNKHHQYPTIPSDIEKTLTPLDKNILKKFFPNLNPRQSAYKKPISPYQKRILEKYGKDTADMSYNEAYSLIGKLLYNNPQTLTTSTVDQPILSDTSSMNQPKVYELTREDIESQIDPDFGEPATKRQLRLIKNKGLTPPPGLTKRGASNYIFKYIVRK